MFKTLVKSSILALLIPVIGYCAQQTPTSSGKATNTNTRWSEQGAQAIYDGSELVTGAVTSGKFLELISNSSVTVPSARHVKVYYSSTTSQLCTLFDSGSTGCISSNTVAAVNPGYGLTNSGTASNPVLNLAAGTTYYIQNTTATQTSSTFTVTGGYVYGNFTATGTVTLGAAGNVTLGNSSNSVNFSTAPKVGGFGINNVANGVSATDVATFGQIHLMQTPVSFCTSGSSGTVLTHFVPTNTKATITPTSTNSKIIILVSGQLENDTSGGLSFASIARGTTDLSAGSGFMIQRVTVTGLSVDQQSAAAVYMDSPATTSATTYTVTIQSQAGTANWGTSGQTQCIILFDVL